MTFVKVASRDELQPGTMKSCEVNGKKLLIANVDGELFALENRCPHIGKPLERGTLEGCTITCPYHQARFDLKTGKNIEEAKILFVKMSCQNAKIFGVKLEGDAILVDQPAV